MSISSEWFRNSAPQWAQVIRAIVSGAGSVEFLLGGQAVAPGHVALLCDAGSKPRLYFHDQTELSVFLDMMREQGVVLDG